jgi:hypothetical protein
MPPLLQVHIVLKQSTPGDAKPFTVAYGKPLDNTNDKVLWASTLVVRVPWTDDDWAIIVNPGGPAEW